MWSRFTRTEQRLIVTLLILLAVGIGAKQLISYTKHPNYTVIRSLEPSPENDALMQERIEASKIDLNTATLQQLDRLPGIGKGKAQAIINWRTLNGGFKTVDDLDKITGFGPSIVEKVRPYVKAGDSYTSATDTFASGTVTQQTASQPSPIQGTLVVELNSATVEQFMQLKGVGKKKAKAIVDYRTANGRFNTVTDLTKVRGIGPKILQDNMNVLTVK